VKQLLPVKPSASENVEEINADYIYEPDKMHIINSLIPRYLNSQMWNILLESYAAELGARMTAMDMATENAHELIRMLKINYNKARQASITTEILEIVSGADALKNE
jgi:F-type H+-transporting ATPase subunit gamma